MPFKVKAGLVQFPEEGDGFTRLTSNEYMTYGHPELIRVIKTATANAIARLPTPRTRVVVKDLNTADGKAAKGHKTHGAGGKNVDLGYFYNGLNITENLFINHAKLPYKVVDGLRVLTKVHPDWNLWANWVLVEELLALPKCTQILVDPLYADLLEGEATRRYKPGGPEASADKLKHALKVIQRLGNHDNHFHLSVDEP